MCLAIPGRILEILDPENGIARVDVAGVTRTVSVGLVDDPRPGEWVLIHVGFALSKVDEQEARSTLDLLRAMGEAYEKELAELGTSAIE